MNRSSLRMKQYRPVSADLSKMSGTLASMFSASTSDSEKQKNGSGNVLLITYKKSVTEVDGSPSITPTGSPFVRSFSRTDCASNKNKEQQEEGQLIMDEVSEDNRESLSHEDHLQTLPRSPLTPEGRELRTNHNNFKMNQQTESDADPNSGVVPNHGQADKQPADVENGTQNETQKIGGGGGNNKRRRRHAVMLANGLKMSSSKGFKSMLGGNAAVSSDLSSGDSWGSEEGTEFRQKSGKIIKGRSRFQYGGLEDIGKSAVITTNEGYHTNDLCKENDNQVVGDTTTQTTNNNKNDDIQLWRPSSDYMDNSVVPPLASEDSDLGESGEFESFSGTEDEAGPDEDDYEDLTPLNKRRQMENHHSDSVDKDDGKMEAAGCEAEVSSRHEQEDATEDREEDEDRLTDDSPGDSGSSFSPFRFGDTSRLSSFLNTRSLRAKFRESKTWSIRRNSEKEVKYNDEGDTTSMMDNAESRLSRLFSLRRSVCVPNTDSAMPRLAEEEESTNGVEILSMLPLPPHTEHWQVKRSYVVNCLMSSENNYIASLQTLVLDYKIQLEGSSPPILSKAKVDILFRRLTDILACHNNFAKGLKLATKSWSEAGKVGHVFVASFTRPHVLEIYSDYINNFNDAMEVARTEAKRKTAFADFLKVKQLQSADRLNLFGLMVKPIQRFPQFIMLLQDLIKETPQGHGDRVPLQLALTILDSLTEKLNERKRQSEQISSCRSHMRTNNIGNKFHHSKSDTFLQVNTPMTPMSPTSFLPSTPVMGSATADSLTSSSSTANSNSTPLRMNSQDGCNSGNFWWSSGYGQGCERVMVREDEVLQLDFNSQGQVIRSKARKLILLNDSVVCASISGRSSNTDILNSTNSPQNGADRLNIKWSVNITDIEVVEGPAMGTLGRLTAGGSVNSATANGNGSNSNGKRSSLGRSVTPSVLAQFSGAEDCEPESVAQEMADLMADYELVSRISGLITGLKYSYQLMSPQIASQLLQQIQTAIRQKDEEMSYLDKCCLHLAIKRKDKIENITIQMKSPRCKQDLITELRLARLSQEPANTPGWEMPAEGGPAHFLPRPNLPLFVRNFVSQTPGGDLAQAEVTCGVSYTVPELTPTRTYRNHTYVWLNVVDTSQAGGLLRIYSAHAGQNINLKELGTVQPPSPVKAMTYVPSLDQEDEPDQLLGGDTGCGLLANVYEGLTISADSNGFEAASNAELLRRQDQVWVITEDRSIVLYTAMEPEKGRELGRIYPASQPTTILYHHRQLTSSAAKSAAAAAASTYGKYSSGSGNGGSVHYSANCGAVWVGCADGRLNVYVRSRPMSGRSNLNVFGGMVGGSSAGGWDIGRPTVTLVLGTEPVVALTTPANSPTSNLLYAATGNRVSIIDTDNFCIVRNLTLGGNDLNGIQGGSSNLNNNNNNPPFNLDGMEFGAECDGTITHIAVAGAGLVVAVDHSSRLQLYHTESLAFIGSMDLSGLVWNAMGETCWPQRQQKSVVVTALRAAKGLLWVGTNRGLTVTLPLPRLGGVPHLSAVTAKVSFHAHLGPVQMFLQVASDVLRPKPGPPQDPHQPSVLENDNCSKAHANQDNVRDAHYPTEEQEEGEVNEYSEHNQSLDCKQSLEALAGEGVLSCKNLTCEPVDPSTMKSCLDLLGLANAADGMSQARKPDSDVLIQKLENLRHAQQESENEHSPVLLRSHQRRASKTLPRGFSLSAARRDLQQQVNGSEAVNSAELYGLYDDLLNVLAYECEHPHCSEYNVGRGCLYASNSNNNTPVSYIVSTLPRGRGAARKTGNASLRRPPSLLLLRNDSGGNQSACCNDDETSPAPVGRPPATGDRLSITEKGCRDSCGDSVTHAEDDVGAGNSLSTTHDHNTSGNNNNAACHSTNSCHHHHYKSDPELNTLAYRVSTLDRRITMKLARPRSLDLASSCWSVESRCSTTTGSSGASTISSNESSTGGGNAGAGGAMGGSMSSASVSRNASFISYRSLSAGPPGQRSHQPSLSRHKTRSRNGLGRHDGGCSSLNYSPSTASSASVSSVGASSLAGACKVSARSSFRHRNTDVGASLPRNKSTGTLRKSSSIANNRNKFQEKPSTQTVTVLMGGRGYINWRAVKSVQPALHQQIGRPSNSDACVIIWDNRL